MSSFYSDMIYEKILETGNEAVFIATDFLDIADYETARKALNRLDSYGKIKKICRGVYYNPKFSELLGEYEAPSPHNVALALARKFNWTIAPSGNTALNQLGLSTQVTAHWTYYPLRQKHPGHNCIQEIVTLIIVVYIPLYS